MQLTIWFFGKKTKQKETKNKTRLINSIIEFNKNTSCNINNNIIQNCL